jgi:uncharacterized protein YyaL (SSP411 family)
VAITGDPAAADTMALLEVLNRRWAPNLVVAAAPPADAAAAALIPLLQERPQREGRATAYVCKHFVCNLPTTDPAEMERQLAE